LSHLSVRQGLVHIDPALTELYNSVVAHFHAVTLLLLSRSERWASLEQERVERNMETEAMREARRKEAEEQQQEEERRLRQQLVHKANPIRRYRGIAIAPSDKHLTEAKSPNFSNRFTR
jgi:hypothetical protein